MYIWASQMALEVKNLPANAGGTGDSGLIPGLGRSPGVGNSNPLQYSCLENSTDRGAWRATVHGIKRVRHELEIKQQIYYMFNKHILNTKFYNLDLYCIIRTFGK